MAKGTEKAAWGGAFNAFSKAWEAIKANPMPAAVMAVAYLAITVIEINTVGLEPTSVKDLVGLGSIELLYSLVFLLAMPTYALALASGKRINLGEFIRFDGKKYGAILVASILYGLAVMGSLLLLIIPAIWVVAWFALYEMIIVDKNMGPVQALKESKRLIRSHKGKVWGIIGVTVLLAFVVGVVSLPLSLLGDLLGSAASALISVLTTTAIAFLYRWVK